MKIIKDWLNKKLICHICNCTKSVKYTTNDDENKTYCNACILQAEKLINRKE